MAYIGTTEKKDINGNEDLVRASENEFTTQEFVTHNFEGILK